MRRSSSFVLYIRFYSPPVLFLRKLLRSLYLFIIAFERPFVINDIWLPRASSLLRSAYLFKIIILISQNLCDINIRNERCQRKSRNVHAVPYGIETASFVATRIWISIPRSHKECSSVNEFKAKIKFWYPWNYPSKLYQNFIS